MEVIKKRANIEYNLRYLEVIGSDKIILSEQIKKKSVLCEDEGKKYVYYNQEKCAEKVRNLFDDKSKIICLVYGMTQTGKTGCMVSSIHHYVLSNNIPIDNIYIITGLSDKEWKKDTKNRVPDSIKERVFHRANLPKTFIKDISEKKNSLIIMDEIQIACEEDQTIYKTFMECGFYDLKFLLENDIKIIQFSATPDGNINDISDWKEHSSKIKLKPGFKYYGVRQAIEQKRVKQFRDLTIMNNVLELKNDIEKNYKDPRYYLIRVPSKRENRDGTDNQNLVIFNFKKVFGKDYEYNKNYLKAKKGDINDILKIKPDKQTFIFYCEILRCAKTQHKEYIGISYERFSKHINDSTIIQGSFGRLTGYDDNGDSICYTNIASLENYIKLWDNDMNFMKGIKWNTKTTHYDPDNDITLSTGTFNSTKYISQMKDNCSEKIKEKQREKEKPIIQKFNSFENLKNFFKENPHLGRGPKRKTTNKDGFYECITQLDKKFTVRSVEYFNEVEKTNNWGFKKNDHKNKYRSYPCYSDINNTKTLEWWLVYYE